MMQIGAVARTLLTPSLVTAVLLIFGGCCSNVYTLESITHTVPDCGSLITFAQFLGVAFGGFVQFSLTHQGRQAIWEHKVPLLEYCKIVGFHFSVSILNNTALDYHISVPVHIILRSGGSMVTMLLAYIFFGRKYTYRQICAVLFVTLGVIISTASGRSSGTSDTASDEAFSRFLIGVSFMVLSQFLSSAMGLYLERTFRVYSPSWRETLFFTHLLALPFFVPFLPAIYSHFKVLMESPPIFPEEKLSVIGFQPFNPPSLVFHLFLNILTQLICVSGVNQLASTSTALSVSIVLNLRKFTSLVISFVMFGHPIDGGVIVGAIFVFVGALWYSQEAPHRQQKLEIKNSDIDLRAMDSQSGLPPTSVGSASDRKQHGTPLLEKGSFEESSTTSGGSPLQVNFGASDRL